MEPEETRALDRLFEVAATQLDLLEDAARRPGVDRAALGASVLEFLLAGIGAAATTAAAAPRLDPARREARAALARRVEALRAATVDVRHHLIELSEGWACGACGADVAKGASVSGVRVGQPRVELVCKACGRSSRLAAKGQAAFDRVWGPRLGPAWNPALDGFAWNER
jgi:hypothetical protein